MGENTDYIAIFMAIVDLWGDELPQSISRVIDRNYAPKSKNHKANLSENIHLVSFANRVIGNVPSRNKIFWQPENFLSIHTLFMSEKLCYSVYCVCSNIEGLYVNSLVFTNTVIWLCFY